MLTPDISCFQCLQAFIVTHQNLSDLTTNVATHTKEKEDVDGTYQCQLDQQRVEEEEVQRLKGETEKTTEEMEMKQKFSELLDNTGMQLWLARIEAMEEYAKDKHLEWDPAVERLAYERGQETSRCQEGHCCCYCHA